MFSCRCGHQFCYLCGKKWKRCLCALFDTEHLLRNGVEGLEEAPVVCRHVWEQKKGTAFARCERTGLAAVMRCSVSR
jgi:hypothetical protein